MKKLLAAVTSFAMSASLMTSAFASSFNVSAAGRVSAVQPNVSIGEVADVAVNKTAQADFVVTPEEVSVNAGESVKVKIFADAGSHKVGTLVVGLDDSDLPQGITADVAEADLRCKAVDGAFTFNKLNGRYYCDTLDSGEPMSLASDKAVIAFTLSVPSNAKAGDYEYNLSHFYVVEDGYNGVEFDATIKPGVIHILGEGETTAPTNTTTQAPSNETTAPSVTTVSVPHEGEFEVDSKFIITPADATVAAGDTVSVNIMCENGSNRKAAQFVAQVINANLPISGATATMTSLRCSAIATKPEYSELNGTWYCDTLDSGEPQEIDTSKAVAKFDITVPSNATPGTYEWKLDRFHVVEDGYNGVEFDATLKTGKLTVTGSGETTTAPSGETTTAPATGTKPASVDEGFIIKPEDVTVEPGQTVNIGLYCTNTSNRKVAQFVARVDDANLPISGATATMKNTKCKAVATSPEYTEIDGTWYCDCLDSGDPQTINTDEPVARYAISIPADAAPGTYEWQPDRFHIVENGYEAIEFDANIQSGKIVVLGGDDTTTTTITTTADTTAAPADSSTTTAVVTTAAPADGKVEWKIPTVKANAGETVKMNVVVNGTSDLAVAGAQFKITPASGITFAGVSDTSAAYKAGIQKNDATNEFAFAEGKGAATAAADGAVVLTISYKVPAGASGTYPVKWSDAFVSDTNGNDITDKVTLTDGAIVVSSEGGISWEIPTVHAKAGKTATLNVKVSDPDGEGLAVAGAQFNINAKTVQLSSVSGSDAYKSDIVNNKNEFAFGEGKGAGVAAADGDSVMVLTFDVPAGTAPGTYDVTWAGDIYISDTDGNDITANVTLIDGAVIVDDDFTEGKVTWTIPEKHAVPGETVELDVLVDAGEENLAVGGAQFNITAKTPIAFSTATGSDGYKAELTFNKDTNEFAFAEAKGAGVEAASGSSVLKLTYTVPEGTAAGEYPVEWSNAFISDTNGNDITADVTLVDGKIIVDELTSTTSESDSTTSADTSTTAADTSTTAADTSTTTASVTEQVLPVTAPEGAVIWQIQRVEAKAGETVTVPVLVLDPNDAKLAVGGAQFGVTAKAPIAYDSVSAKSDAYASDIVANKSTFEFAFANAKGAETAAANNAVVFNLTYTVPEGTAAGEYPVTWTKDFFNASNSNGEDISSFVVCLDGAIIVVEDTTTTTGETTTATATETTTASETETTLTVAEGAIVWQAQTVTAAPGEEVDVDVLVLDPNDTKLEVGGAQFIISCDAALQSGTGSAAYSADIQSGVNGDANRFAFAHPKGQGIAAASGAKVITLKYKVPDTAKDGDKYPVVIGELNASDTNGLDITKHIVCLDGAILVKVPETTTSSEATTTATTEATTTTPVVTAPDGAIIWQIQRVEAEAGQTVTVPVLVLDPNAVNLAVGGAQFGVTAKTPIAYSAVSNSDAYGSDVVANTSTFEFAFANAKGAEMAAANGAVVFNLTYTVPEGTEAGEYPVTWTKDFFNASNSNGEDITNYILCLDGAIIVKPVTTSAADTTTTGEDTATTASETASATDTDTDTTSASETATDTETTTASETDTETTSTGTVTTLPDAAKYVIVEGTAIDGFYFNHDGRSFNKGHVTATKLTVVMSDGTTEELTFDESALSFKEKVSGEDNPMAAYNEEQTDFTYNVDAFYGGKPLEFADGNPVTFKVYIGVKGDSNLDNKADAKDASNALAFYSKVSVKEATVSSDDIMINPESNKIITDHPELDLDQFGAFLADVDKDVYDEDNWKTTKSGRVIDAKDASSILRYYSIMSSGGTDRQAAWNDAVSGREEKIRDFLITE